MLILAFICAFLAIVSVFFVPTEKANIFHLIPLALAIVSGILFLISGNIYLLLFLIFFMIAAFFTFITLLSLFTSILTPDDLGGMVTCSIVMVISLILTAVFLIKGIHHLKKKEMSKQTTLFIQTIGESL